MDLFQEKEKDKEDGEERKKEGKRRWKEKKFTLLPEMKG